VFVGIQSEVHPVQSRGELVQPGVPYDSLVQSLDSPSVFLTLTGFTKLQERTAVDFIH
jgi:hypothetical protein